MIDLLVGLHLVPDLPVPDLTVETNLLGITYQVTGNGGVEILAVLAVASLCRAANVARSNK